MRILSFALPPVDFSVPMIGLGLIIVFAVFTWSRQSRPLVTDENAARLNLISLLVGPWMGLVFACRFLVQGEVRTEAFFWHLVVEGAAGSFAGWLAGTIFLFTAALTKSRCHPVKPPGDVWDREWDGGR